MDTGTHFVTGLGLAGLAYIDPAVAQDPVTATAIFAATVVGSQAPDADGLLRLKGNSTYIRNHRGWSHSIPAWFIWTMLITGGLKLFFPSVSMITIALWTFIAVVLHVVSDMFNTYGTQAMRPITEKWISWNIIHIFDPFIFFSHVIALLLWVADVAQPQIIFPVLYGILFLYYVWRSYVHLRLMKQVKVWDQQYHAKDTYTLIPTISLNHWNVVKCNEMGDFMIGEIKDKKLHWMEHIQPRKHPAIESSKSHRDIASFLYFSSHACPELRIHSWGYEVRWIDLRYRHRKQYPFLGVLLMDHKMNPLDAYVGWINEERIEKKLGLNYY